MKTVDIDDDDFDDGVAVISFSARHRAAHATPLEARKQLDRLERFCFSPASSQIVREMRQRLFMAREPLGTLSASDLEPPEGQDADDVA
jgi:hypothetical protein